MDKRHQAAALNEQARQFQERGLLRRAAARYRRAAAADATWDVPRYNLGLLYKQQQNWEQALRYNRQAIKLDQTNAAAWWNLGIAATALRRWRIARSAWRGYGLEVPDGRGPVDLPCGFGPVRLRTDSGGEVVWADRLDPARAELASIPFPESGHRWRDVILNDGAPNGYRRYQGKEVPVLDELQLLRSSRFGTYVAQLAIAEPTATRSLVELAAQRGGSAEDWTTSTRILCRACSEGRPHSSHDTEAALPAGLHIAGIAARDRAHASAILREWEEQTKYAEVQSLEVGLKARRSRKPGS
jgi:tetratricopeptide (TPR) repeat protein